MLAINPKVIYRFEDRVWEKIRKAPYNLRSNSDILLEPPKGKMLVTLGERAFQAAAPHLCNELPLQLRTVRSVETFKNSIKTFLFRQSFNGGHDTNFI